VYRFVQNIATPSTRHGGFPCGFIEFDEFGPLPEGWEIAEVESASDLPLNVYEADRVPLPNEVWTRCSAWFDSHPLAWQAQWAPLVSLLTKQFNDVLLGLKTMEQVRAFVATLGTLDGVETDDVTALLAFFDDPVEVA
jgi:hypothetical protein